MNRIGWIRGLWRLLTFVLFYLYELVYSNVKLAYDILFARHNLQPGVVAMPLEKHSDLALLMLSNLISMTPGSLALDLSDDHGVLYVHAMYAADAAGLRQALKDDFEKRILEIGLWN